MREKQMASETRKNIAERENGAQFQKQAQQNKTLKKAVITRAVAPKNNDSDTNT